MDSYQKNLYEKFERFRPSPSYPTYPPYHKGLYLEDYFIERYSSENLDVSRYLIPVSWTTCYVENKINGLQQLIDSLDRTKKYFTVAQHDDAIREILPPDTLCFNAGGNGGGVPIPLICSPISTEEIEDVDRDIFCSFVGSITHPIRSYLLQSLGNKEGYYFSARNWTSSVSDGELQNFISITKRSIFALVPRGYGRSSFRLYEVMQLDAIPVFVYDEPWFPFEGDLDWDSFSVRVHVSQIEKIDQILKSIDVDTINSMRRSLSSVWSENFNMNSVYKIILSKI